MSIWEHIIIIDDDDDDDVDACEIKYDWMGGGVLFELFEFSLWGISHLKGIISRSNRIYPRIFRNKYFTEEEKPWTVSLC